MKTRVVNIAVLVLVPIVSASTGASIGDTFVRSIDMGIGDTFSLIFLAIFDTNTFVVKCTS